jgi:hypothetical protein
MVVILKIFLFSYKNNKDGYDIVMKSTPEKLRWIQQI